MVMLGLSVLVFLVVWTKKNLGDDAGDHSLNLSKLPLHTIFLMSILARVGVVTVIMGLLWNTYSHR